MSEGAGEAVEAADDDCLLAAFVVATAVVATATTLFVAAAAPVAATGCKEAVAAATGEGLALTGGLGFLMGGAYDMLHTAHTYMNPVACRYGEICAVLQCRGETIVHMQSYQWHLGF